MEEDRKSVDDLIVLAPPPALLVDRVPWNQWRNIEQKLGVTLPDDYKLIMTTYGSGVFNDLFWLFNPVSQSESLNLVNQVQRMVLDLDPHLEMYEFAKPSFPEACPFPSFPESGGLFPAGGDINGGYAFWQTIGHPNEWPLILYPHGLWKFERYDMPLVEFLVLWLSGKLPDCFFGAGKFFVNRTDPIFQN